MIIQVRIDADAAISELENLRRSFENAIRKIEPTFGAFMPYSYYAEYGNGYFPPQPSVEPAIINNSTWIITEFMSRTMPALDRASKGGNIAGLREEVAAIWEQVLNDKPRREAYAMARYRTGAHRSSIGGHATEAGVFKAIAEGDSKAKFYKDTMNRMRSGR